MKDGFTSWPGPVCCPFYSPGFCAFPPCCSPHQSLPAQRLLTGRSDSDFAFTNDTDYSVPLLVQLLPLSQQKLLQLLGLAGAPSCPPTSLLKIPLCLCLPDTHICNAPAQPVLLIYFNTLVRLPQ